MKLSEIRAAHGPKSWNKTAERNSDAESLHGVESFSFNYKDLLNPLKFFRILWRTNVFHFYFGYTLLPVSLNNHKLFARLGGIDLFFLKIFRKKIILHFQGCEIRDRYNPNAFVVCANCAVRDVFCTTIRSSRRRMRLLKLASIADGIAVTTPDLKNYLGDIKATWIPKIATMQLSNRSKVVAETGKLKVIHAPSDRSIKGTNIIIDVFDRLSDKFELQIIENVSRDEVIAKASKADIAIDQIRIGWYGNFAVEMMELGLPVICNINPAYITTEINQFPIIHADEASLEECLNRLYLEREILNQQASKNYAYLVKVHSKQAVSEILKKIYSNIN